MGQPVVHFEVVGKDADKLRDFYSKLFSWQIDANNPMGYGMVRARRMSTRTASGSAAASDRAPTATTVT